MILLHRRLKSYAYVRAICCCLRVFFLTNSSAKESILACREKQKTKNIKQTKTKTKTKQKTKQNKTRKTRNFILHKITYYLLHVTQS